MDTTPRAAAKDGAKPEEKRSLSHRIAHFLGKSRKLLLAIAIVVLAAILVLSVITVIRSSADKASAMKVEELSNDANAWSAETDATKKADLEKKLNVGVAEVLAKYPGIVAAQQALAIKATIAESKKDWAEAEKDWIDAANRLPTSFLAPVSLRNAAVAAEEQGADDRAKAHYKALIDKYSGSAAGIAHAWFALGRIAEESKDYSAAVANYEKVVATWPSSDWTKLSKDRIISIKSRGLVK